MANLSSRWIGNVLRFYAGANNIQDIDGDNLVVTTQGSQQPTTNPHAGGALTRAMSGQLFIGAVDAVFTLPAAVAALKGVWYTFMCGTPSAGTGLKISPNGTDVIQGNGLTAVAGKGIINTGATDRVYDQITLVCTGAEWAIESVVGTWAKEP